MLGLKRYIDIVIFGECGIYAPIYRFSSCYLLCYITTTPRFHIRLNTLLLTILQKLCFIFFIINPPFLFTIFVNTLINFIVVKIVLYMYTHIENSLHQGGSNPNPFNNMKILSNLLCYNKYTINSINK